MSTRANIVFLKNCKLETDRLKDIENLAYLIMYCHSDGYPEGLGKLISEAIKYTEKREYDIDYRTMCILNYICNKNREDIKNQNLTGFGISTELASDIEYIYLINITSEKVECYEIEFNAYKLGKLVYGEFM